VRRASSSGASSSVASRGSRLLIHPPGLWSLRPAAYDPHGIPNLFLAGDYVFLVGDYVQNDTDLATMEGANQSAQGGGAMEVSSQRVRFGEREAARQLASAKRSGQAGNTARRSRPPRRR